MDDVLRGLIEELPVNGASRQEWAIRYAHRAGAIGLPAGATVGMIEMVLGNPTVPDPKGILSGCDAVETVDG